MLIIALLINLLVNGQEVPQEIKEADFKPIIAGENHLFTLGFRGKRQKRLFVRFLEINKTEKNPLIYKVSGLTKMEEDMIPFEGDIRIKKVKVDPKSDLITAALSEEEKAKNYTFYEVTGSYYLKEPTKMKGAGRYQGTWTCNVKYSESEGLTYNMILMGDEYANNTFKGNWKENGKKDREVANWGEYRIPDAGDLDVGESQFMPNQKNRDPNWQLFYQAAEDNYATDPYDDRWWEEPMAE